MDCSRFSTVLNCKGCQLLLFWIRKRISTFLHWFSDLCLTRERVLEIKLLQVSDDLDSLATCDEMETSVWKECPSRGSPALEVNITKKYEEPQPKVSSVQNSVLHSQGWVCQAKMYLCGYSSQNANRELHSHSKWPLPFSGLAFRQSDITVPRILCTVVLQIQVIRPEEVEESRIIAFAGHKCLVQNTYFAYEAWRRIQKFKTRVMLSLGTVLS